MGKFITFLFIFFVIVLGYFAVLNRESVDVYFLKDHPYSIPMTALVLISSAVGAFLMFLTFAVRDTRRFIFNIHRQKTIRKEDKIRNLYSKALDAFFAQRWDEAKQILEQILKEDPERIDAILKLGDIAHNSYDYNAAFDYFKRANTLDPSRVETLFALIKVKEAMNAFPDALGYVDEILAVDENNIRALFKKRDLLEKMGRWEDLINLQKNIVVRSKPSEKKEDDQGKLSGYEYEFGRYAMEQGELEKAQKAFRSVIKLEKGFIPAHLGLAEIMIKEDNGKEAVNYLENIYKQTRSLIILARLEDILIETGEPARLIRIYKNSLIDDPDNNTLKFFLGKLYHRLEMLDDAVEVLEDVDSSYSYPEISKIKGSIYTKRNQHEKAAEEFKKVIDMKKALRLPYCCSNCGFLSVAWSGRCPSCNNWDTYQFDIFGSCRVGVT